MKVDFVAGALPYAEQLGWKVCCSRRARSSLSSQRRRAATACTMRHRTRSNPRMGSSLP